MAYRKPYVDAAGLHIPTYNEILDDLIIKTKAIFGEDIYLEPDSQDYQLLSIFALDHFDKLQTLELVYNNRSPKTAIGTALDGLVKLNGIKRKSASYSTVELTLTGVIGTVITNGVAEDEGGNKWIMSQNVVLESNPYKVTARSEKVGSYPTGVGTITKIVTPTKGWISVTNEKTAVLGDPVETDAELKKRQTDSVANPSRSILKGIKGGLARVPNVKRLQVYENDTNITDDRGIEAHSIAAVVEGGLDKDIAETIFLRKGPGCGTHGNTVYNYVTERGVPYNIRFDRPDMLKTNVTINVKRLEGYTDETAARIKAYVTKRMEAFNIGETAYVSDIWAAAISAIINPLKPTFAVTEVTFTDTGDAFINCNYNQVVAPNNINIVEV